MRAWPLGTLVVVLSVGTPVRSDVDAKPIADYDALLDRYRQGPRAEAVGDLGSWSAKDVEVAVKSACRAGQYVPSWYVPTALMLHTDRAFETQAGGDAEGAWVHFDAARALARSLGQTKVGSAFAARWFLAVGLLQAQAGTAWEWLDAGLKVDPDHPGLLLAMGSFEGGSRHVPFRAGPLDNRTAEARRVQAEFYLRRALKEDPNTHEARVRLAQMLVRQGKDDEALKELETAIRQSRQPDVMYLARLFWGRIRERQGHLAEAAEAYAAALALDGSCQTAQVALSHVRWRLGDVAAAVAGVERVVTEGDPASECLDPWWLYPWGQRRQAAVLLDALRAEAVR